MRFQAENGRKRDLTGYHRIVRLTIVLLVFPAVILTGVMFFRELQKMKVPEGRVASDEGEVETDDTRWVRVTPVPAKDVSAEPIAPPTPTTTTDDDVAEPEATEEKPAQSPEEAMREVMVGLKDVVDGTPLEEGPFHWLLGRAARNFGNVDLLSRRMPDTVIAELCSRPKDFRGKTVKLTGLVQHVSTSEITANPYGLRYVQSGSLLVGKSNLVSFFVPGPRPVCRTGDRVRLYGLFFKVEEYVDKGDRQALAPAVVVTSVEMLKRAGRPTSTSTSAQAGWDRMMMMIYVVAGLLAVWAVMRIYQKRKQSAHYARMDLMRQRRKEHSHDDTNEL